MSNLDSGGEIKKRLQQQLGETSDEEDQPVPKQQPKAPELPFNGRVTETNRDDHPILIKSYCWILLV